jgi:hypothetical protein
MRNIEIDYLFGVRIVNDINYWHWYWQPYETWLIIPDVEANDVNNLWHRHPHKYSKVLWKIDWLFRVENSQWYQLVALISALQRTWLVSPNMGN